MFLFLIVPICSVLGVVCMVWMLWGGRWLPVSISILTSMFLPMSPLFLDMMSSYLSHNCSEALWVLGEMSLSAPVSSQPTTNTADHNGLFSDSPSSSNNRNRPTCFICKLCSLAAASAVLGMSEKFAKITSLIS